MAPTFSTGEAVLVIRYFYRILPPRIGDIVIARSPTDNRFLIKRVVRIEREHIFLQGDNTLESTDSRKFGMIKRSGLVGKVICKV